MGKLTLKQQKFADEYIISGNATEAAILAGYSKVYAGTNTDKLLKNTNIKAYIAERLEEINNNKIADQQEVLQYLTSIMRGEQKEQTLISAGDHTQEITDIDVSAKDRIKAAELIGKRYGTWTDRLDINADIGVTIIDDMLGENDECCSSI